jgi:hypothetical protein
MILYEMALAMGFPSVNLMLSMMDSKDYSEWKAYYYVKSGAYENYHKHKSAGKVLRQSLKHLVKKKDG